MQIHIEGRESPRVSEPRSWANEAHITQRLICIGQAVVLQIFYPLHSEKTSLARFPGDQGILFWDSIRQY